MNWPIIEAYNLILWWEFGHFSSTTLPTILKQTSPITELTVTVETEICNQHSIEFSTQFPVDLATLANN